jgi:capsular polysaccharide biosynthesis protein
MLDKDMFEDTNKLRAILFYIAAAMTFLVFSVTYNQHTLCEVQKSNVQKSVQRNYALDQSFIQQINLYKRISELKSTSPEVRNELLRSKRKIESARRSIFNNQPEEPRCFIIFNV